MIAPSDKAAEAWARLPYSDDEWFKLSPRERNELHDEAAAKLSYDDGYEDAVLELVERLNELAGMPEWKPEVAIALLYAVCDIECEFGGGS